EINNIREGKRIIQNGDVQFKVYYIDWEERVFPGETIDILGSNSNHLLIYEFNRDVLFKVKNETISLDYSLYFEDHPPIKESIDFKKLNAF
ncbi:MAG: hypothetical protein JXA92_08935, partial [candidate division Zixibacteria bacterium]|nr:hypothetical protein [candidate division Zixibacteria bacterium]